MREFFPDTNFFLECRKATDLPWNELAADNAQLEVRLIVPPTVITEIERHKMKGNSRTARRARDTSAALRLALQSADHRIELRSKNPRVLLELPPVVKVDFSQFPNLDHARPDHRIAGEYAEIQRGVPDLRVLSDDTLLILTVRSLGFDPVLIPESWKLPPEKDERDDEIERLRVELRSYKQDSPEIAISVMSSCGEPLGNAPGQIQVFEPSADEMDRAIALAKDRFPIAKSFQRTPPPDSTIPGRAFPALLGTWRPPREEDIESYKATKYPEWLNSVREALPRVAAQLNLNSHEVPFVVRISNIGFVNASHARLTVNAYDGILLLGSLGERDAERRDASLALPPPPQPPNGGYVNFLSAFDAFSAASLGADLLRGIYTPEPRNPNAFYYVSGRPTSATQELELTCEALPHQGDPYSRGLRIVIQPDNIGQKPRLRVRLEARNLRKPVVQHINVSFAVR